PVANSAVVRIFGGVRASCPWALVVFLVVVFVAPLCEEIIYRGLLWGAVDRRWGRWAALVVTTVVFALAHLEFARAPLLVVVAIPIALARFYSGGLLA
ncbi:CPBP family intramembrane metalloprotease, partial [Klebsiella pneumoniae]|nr:CPBP family intramembrane metalloprotease [Klebsiella pneumoniae]